MLSSDVYVVQLSFLASLVCYLPSYLNMRLRERHTDNVILFMENPIYTHTLVASVALSVLMGFEVALDYNLPRSINLPRAFIVFALGVPSAIKLTAEFLNEDIGAGLTVCSYYSQDCLFVGALFAAMMTSQCKKYQLATSLTAL